MQAVEPLSYPCCPQDARVTIPRIHSLKSIYFHKRSFHKEPLSAASTSVA